MTSDTTHLDTHGETLLVLVRAALAVHRGRPSPELEAIRDWLAEREQLRRNAEQSQTRSVPPPDPRTPFGQARIKAAEATATLGRLGAK